MAKTRAQRKAEKRKRQQQAERQGEAGDGGAAQRDATERAEEERGQEDTQHGVSGEVAEAEAVMRSGAQPEDYGEKTVERDQGSGSPVPGVVPAPVQPEAETPEAPAPSRADVGAPADGAEAPAKETREERKARKEQEKEERRRARAKEQQKTPTDKAEKRRGPVTGFLASCWAELKRVQWPDRDTLVQATAVTFIFITVLSAYLGALDAVFNWLVKSVL